MQKENVSMPFSGGLNTKVDANQVPLGQFLALNNGSFDKAGALTKRNGFGRLSKYSGSGNLGSYKSNLMIMNNTLNVSKNDTWASAGELSNVALDVTPLVRADSSQTACDSYVAGDLICTASTQVAAPFYNYYVSQLSTGRILLGPVGISSDTSPKVISLGGNFIIFYTLGNTIYALPISFTLVAGSPITVCTNYNSSYDICYSNNRVFVAYRATDVGQVVRMKALTTLLTTTSEVVVDAAAPATPSIVRIGADNTISGSLPQLYITYYTSGSNMFMKSYDWNFNVMFNRINVPGIGVSSINNTGIVARNGTAVIIYEGTAVSGGDVIRWVTYTSAGSSSDSGLTSYGLRLYSRPFVMDDSVYYMAIYKSQIQPTYFLLKYNTGVKAMVASGNGPSSFTSAYNSVSVDSDGNAYVPYLLTYREEPVNKDVGSATPYGIETTTGINLAKFSIKNAHNLMEIAEAAHIPGGNLDLYDNRSVTEHGFYVYPEITAVVDAGSGTINADTLYYQAVYRWQDNQGNIHRSAPSLPFAYTNGSSNRSINVTVTNYAFSKKTGVVIELYRYSVTQPAYYRVATTANLSTQATVTITDNVSLASAPGNLLLYTTGGVLENSPAPASEHGTVYRNRMWLLSSEDGNLLWYSKPILETTPVEFSAYQTYYVPQIIGTQNYTGHVTALAPMDDKLIVFKENSIAYIVGNGPDITGNNNDLSEATFVSGTVGCVNYNSIATIPNGLMFQSNKGIWLLGRDLSTNYIGAPVESYNSKSVVNTVTVPGTNQVRFLLDDGTFLVYDYYFNQWGTFTGPAASDSIVHNDLHTCIRSDGTILAETPGKFLDDSSPVLLSFTTPWASLAGLAGFERLYYFYLLGQFISPHKLQLELSYDYNPYTAQSILFSPSNFNNTYDTTYGDAATWGGNSAVEQVRVFPQQQKCQAFQIKLTEVYDSSYSTPPGEGLRLSGLNLVIGRKSGYARLKPSQSVG